MSISIIWLCKIGYRRWAINGNICVPPSIFVNSTHPHMQRYVLYKINYYTEHVAFIIDLARHLCIKIRSKLFDD